MRVRGAADANCEQAAAAEMGFVVLGQADSVLPGAKSGNVEHFLHLRR